jgi:hypothetical protein
MRRGRRLQPDEGLDAARARLASELARLPADMKGLEVREGSPVRIAPELERLAT